MDAMSLEYVGFRTEPASRSYVLRIRSRGGEARDVTLTIPFRAFAAGLARYQDGPEICFAKLSADLLVPGGAPPPDHQELTDDDLLAFRLARAPKPKPRRARPAEALDDEAR